jgi:hypothetical protein
LNIKKYASAGVDPVVSVASMRRGGAAAKPATGLRSERSERRGKRLRVSELRKPGKANKARTKIAELRFLIILLYLFDENLS